MDFEVLWKKLHLNSTLKDRQDLETEKGNLGSENCGQRQVTSQCELEDERSEERVGNVGHDLAESCG